MKNGWHLICVYDCFDNGRLGADQRQIELALRMFIPVNSTWRSDYGVPQALLPIPRHTSGLRYIFRLDRTVCRVGMALICEKAACVLDFRVLYGNHNVRDLTIKDLPMMWPSVDGPPGERYPVHLVREFFFKLKQPSKHDDSPDFIWEKALREQTRNSPAHDFHELITFDFCPDEETLIDNKWQKASLKLCLGDGSIQTIDVTFCMTPTHTIWKNRRVEVSTDAAFQPGLRLCCLSSGVLFFYSEGIDHFLMESQYMVNGMVYGQTQILENSGPIADFLQWQNAEHETGRVLFTASPLRDSGSVKQLSPGVMTEDLCVSPQFSCLTGMWKIHPIGQSAELIVASFLHETKVLMLKGNNTNFDTPTSMLVCRWCVCGCNVSYRGHCQRTHHLLRAVESQLLHSGLFHLSKLSNNCSIQVTGTRAALCSRRISEELKAERTLVHSKHVSTSSLTGEDFIGEALPRRWYAT